MVVCAVCSKDVFICEVCKRVLFVSDVLHIEREFTRFHILHRTFCVHLCGERCMRHFDEYLTAEVCAGRVRVKQSFL